MRDVAKLVSRGTHRAVLAEETWRRIMPMLPAMGITRVADVTGLDIIGIPVWQAIRPNGRTLSLSQGKGISHELARVSGAMEAIETWHAEEGRMLPTVGASVDEMTPALTYSLFDLPRPQRSILSGSTQLRWIAGREIGSEEPQWIPQICAVLDSTDPGFWSPPVLNCDSNGLASGNTVEEALLHALYEAVERDAVARRPADRSGLELDPATVWGCSAEVLDRFAAADVEVRVYDITHLSELPCYEVEIWSADLPVRFGGFGCHRDPDVALSRALTEAAQSRLTCIAGSRDDLRSDVYEELSSRPHLRSPFTPLEPARAFPPEGQAAVSSWEDDLHVAITAVRNLTGGAVLWVDLTRPEFDIPVVKVVIPGLQLRLDRIT
ncbi:YcaO-like family protein [Streptomyces sp. NPDC005574]|uniref:YcaO-like family protein n=1 Tax=Streptomyces sp. NPDC005574 TaxID=3156891 RepID=UPI0033A24844